ncbi:MAG: toll/interleukin-1 receptor domain-containing protein, partial [bacterium]|nr:toll/interleukin-1 receptor domain-containing protein [bacterium]
MTNQTIFISHSTKDDDHINRIADTLQQAGHTVWVDHRNGIMPGTPSWDKEIRMAIKNADVGVFIMSENSLDSGICGAECLLVQELKKPLYVLRLQDCKPENIWLYIKQIQYADLVKNFDTGMNAFLGALGGATGAELPTPYLTTVTGRDTLRIYLPFLKNPLRGRNADVQAIQALIGPHITQIIGVGGWGKSRLSAEIALAYPTGAVWHRCSEVSSHTDLLRLFRTHLDLPDETKPDDVLARLGQFKPLVVVDNAEDVMKADVREGYVMLLRQVVANDVPVLITTRRLWDEFKPRKQYPPPQLPSAIASQITADFAHSQDIPLTLDQADALATAARRHPRLIEFAVLLIPEIGYDVTLRRLKSLKDDNIQEALDDMIRKTLDQMRDEAK